MAVRFLPPPNGQGAESTPDREDLAEVIDLRSRLVSHTGTQAAARPASRHSVADLASLREEVARIEAASGSEAAMPARTTRPVDPAVPAESTNEREAPLRSAEEDGVRLLARKARSSGELRRELVLLGHDAHQADAAVLHCEGSLYLDDLGLARTLAENLRERKRASLSQIRMKLRERLIPDGVIEAALGEFDDQEEEALLAQAAGERARRLASLDRVTAERRLLGFLARRGWSGESARRAAREALDEAGVRTGGAGRPGTGKGGAAVRFR